MDRTEIAARDVYVALAPLFEHPSADTVAAAETCAHLAIGSFREAAPALVEFAGSIAKLSGDALEELHLRTFVVAPSCVPYVGVHLYGEESFKRGELMALLRDGFEAHDFHAREELPDHVAVLLRFAGRLSGDELRELETWLLALPVQSMGRALAGSANPYRALVEALELLVTRHGIPDDVREALAERGADGADGGGADGGCSTCHLPSVAVGGPPS